MKAIKIYVDRTRNGFTADLVDASNNEFLGGTKENADREAVVTEAKTMAEVWHPGVTVTIA